MSLAAFGAVAQINSPCADGYLTRSRSMMSDRIYTGAFDQAREAGRVAVSPSEEQLYLEAVAACKTGFSGARRLLDGFASRYPESPMMPLIRVAMGDCFLEEGNYPEALAQYRLAGKGSLGGTDAEDLAFRLGYTCLMTGDYKAAERHFASLAGSAEYAEASKFYNAYLCYAGGDYDRALKLFAGVDRSGEPGCAAPYYEAQIFYRLSKWDRAAEICRALVNHPVVPQFTPEATRILGESLWHSATTPDMRGEAVGLLWKYAASVESAEPSALYILGVSEYEAGRYSEAIGLLQRVIADRDPLAQSAYLYMGQCYSHTGNANAALMAFEHAYRLDLNREVSETAFYNYVVTKMGGGNAPFASSISMLESFLRQYPDSRYASDVESYLVNGYLTENDYEAALAGIERVKRPTPKIEGARQRVLFVLGTRDYANGLYSQALRRLTAAEAITPAKGGDASVATQCVLWAGDCRYALGRYDEAASDYLRYLKLVPASDGNRPTALYDLAYARFASHRYGDALTDFKRFVALRGISPSVESDAYCRMGDCRYYAGNYADAAADYRQAYELNPSAGDYPLFQLAVMKGLLREHKVKIATIDEMIRAYPGSPLVPSALLEKAESYAALDDQDSALKTYKELTRRYPSTSQGRKGLLQLAITHLARGSRREAVEAYRRVISTYPTSEEASLALDDLKRIYAEEGRLDELTKFLATVGNAPSIDSSELDALAFDAAEKAYTSSHDTGRIDEYLKKYPQGRYRPQALYYLAESASAAGRNEEAIRIAAELLENHPDAEAAEEVMLIKADAEAATGRTRQAFDTYKALEPRASTPGIQRRARIGMVRQGVATEAWADVVAAAERLGATSAAGSDYLSEIGWSHGRALAALGRHEEASTCWRKVIDRSPGDEYASRSAVSLASMLLDNGQLKQARKVADTFINSNPPQPYWLARGFIVLSDVLRRQGDTFEADEYLRSLRNNYPGKEEDIFRMIDERLKN